MFTTIEADFWRAKIRRGSWWLSNIYGPEWYEHVNLMTLDMGDSFACILGQISESYEYACDQHGITKAKAVALGFYVTDELQHDHLINVPDSYNVLSHCWRMEIARLRDR